MSEVKPALTAEEWEEGEVKRGPGGYANNLQEDGGLLVSSTGEPSYHDCAFVYAEMRHAIAALALEGQPFGFTHEHLAAVALCAEWSSARSERGADAYGVRMLREVYDLIAALLPPRDRNGSDRASAQGVTTPSGQGNEPNAPTKGSPAALPPREP